MKNLIYFTQRDGYPFSKPSLRYWLTKNLITFLAIILILLPQQGCNTTEPTLKPELALELEDVSCTEAWIQLTTNNIQLPATINLLKNNSISQVFVLNTQDSLLYIDSLLPNQNYSFQVSHIVAGSIQHQVTSILSNKLTVTTLDTTSHEFSWQSWEFGEITNQSTLYDAAIIDENNIWAVGEIYMLDSLGRPDPNAYNAVHWDGTKWELKRIYTYSSCNPVDYAPLKAVWVFSDTNIVVTSGGSIGWYNGKTNRPDCTIRPLLTGSLNKLWGSSSEDLYAVGNNGNIAHYNGTSWTKIESGTELSLSDISKNSRNAIFVCGGNLAYAKGIILKSDDGKNFSKFVEGDNIPESQLFNPKLYGSFSSIWVDENNTLYSGGNILFQNKLNHWSYVKSLPENYIGGNPGVYYRGYITRVKGTASNDMWIAGDRNTVRHFNGITWQQIGLPYNPNIDLVWRGIDCSENITVIAGSYNRSATIIMIKR